MGQEYHISTKVSALEELKTLCSRLGGQLQPEYPTTFEFRCSTRDDSSTMPDASATLEADHIWFCDHGGSNEFVAPIFFKLLNVALRHSEWPDGIRVAQP